MMLLLAITLWFVKYHSYSEVENISAQPTIFCIPEGGQGGKSALDVLNI